MASTYHVCCSSVERWGMPWGGPPGGAMVNALSCISPTGPTQTPNAPVRRPRPEKRPAWQVFASAPSSPTPTGYHLTWWKSIVPKVVMSIV